MAFHGNDELQFENFRSWDSKNLGWFSKTWQEIKHKQGEGKNKWEENCKHRESYHPAHKENGFHS